MLIHAVVEVEHGKIAVRDTTCACNYCFNQTGIHVQPECGWDVRCIDTKMRAGVVDNVDANNDTTNNKQKVNDQNINKKTEAAV